MSKSESRSGCFSALGRFLEIFVKMSLRIGIGFSEMQRLLRVAYVKVARDDFGVAGKPASISRIAQVTGIARKTVRQLSEDIGAGDSHHLDSMNISSLALHHWQYDSSYLDETGKPKELRLTGEGQSFTTLLAKYFPDPRPKEVLMDLMRRGALEVVRPGCYRPVTRRWTTRDSYETYCYGVGAALTYLASTLERNMAVAAKPYFDTEKSHRFFQWTVFYESAPDFALDRFRRLADSRCKEFSLAMDDSFSTLGEVYVNDDNRKLRKDTRKVGVGVFYFELEDDGSQGNSND